MNFFYWLLARCQIAVWSIHDFQALVLGKDLESLQGIDFSQLRRDMFFYWFAMATGYGPILP